MGADWFTRGLTADSGPARGSIAKVPTRRDRDRERAIVSASECDGSPNRQHAPAMLAAMAGPAKRHASYEDLLAVPDHLVAEIVNGELITSPRPSIPHAGATSALGGHLSGPFQFGWGGPGGWWILFAPELRLDEHVLVPDLAGWRRKRLPRLPDAPAMELPPDWLCEVISPSTGRLDRVRKLPIYALAGVQHLWLVDPSQRTLEVYRLEGERWLLVSTHGDDEVVRAEPFDTIQIDLVLLWGETR